MKIFMILLCTFACMSCDSDDPLTQADCERIMDPARCSEKGCNWEAGRLINAKCGEECHFPVGSTPFSMCFLTDNSPEENVPYVYHRLVGDTYEIVDLNSNIGKVTGWEDGTPACVECTYDN